MVREGLGEKILILTWLSCVDSILKKEVFGLVNYSLSTFWKKPIFQLFSPSSFAGSKLDLFLKKGIFFFTRGGKPPLK